jgi:nucleoid-associated protein YgaU
VASSINRLTRAVVAVGLIVAVLVGVPIILMVVGGWPLPTKTPDWHGVYWQARQGDVPADFVIKAFACVVWLAWAQIAWALVWELLVNVPRTLRGRTERASPATVAPASRFARRLVSAAMLLTAITSTPATSVAAPQLASLVSAGDGVVPSPTASSTLVVHEADTTRSLVAPTTSVWVAAAGDTLWDVAERCFGDGSSVDDLLKCNPQLDPGRALRVGQRVELPAGVVAPADRTTGHTSAPSAGGAVVPSSASVTVQPGDTLWELAEDHYGWVNADLVREVSSASELDDPSLILPGDVIVFPPLDSISEPPGAPPSGEWESHRVVSGDTVWDIVETRYGLVDADMVWAFAAVNHLENPSLITPGQVLLLPTEEELVRLAADPTANTESPTTGDSNAPSPPPDSAGGSSENPSDQAVETDEPAETAAADEPEVSDVQAPATNVAVTDPEEEETVAAATTDPVVLAPTAPTAAPSTAATPSAPSTSDQQVRAPVRVDADDMLSSRWLFGGIAATSLGLVGAWMTVKELRRKRRRWLGLSERHDPSGVPTRADVDAALDVSMLDTLVDPTLREGSAVRGVLLGDRAEIRFRHVAPEPPRGWEAVDRSWVQIDGEGPWDAAPVLSPAVVTVGHGTDGMFREVVLDLLTAGTVSVTGDRLAVDRMICSMLWELASNPLGVAVDLCVVGVSCVAAGHTANVGRLLSLDEAIEAAREPLSGAPQVFLVDPFADENRPTALRELAEACAPSSGRALVVAGPCEHPTEQIGVPSEQRATWDDLTLSPPQLPEEVDVQLAQMLDAIAVGRRDSSRAAAALTSDPEAEAVALRTAVMIDDPDRTHGTAQGDDDAAGDDDSADVHISEPVEPASPITDLVEPPEVVLTVCGREIAVDGFDVPHAAAVLFVLAAAGDAMHTGELAELTGYAPKSLSTVFPSAHPLIERESGSLRLRSHVWTDHGWMTHCVTALAESLETAEASGPARVWSLSAMDGLRSLQQAPYAVVPAGRAGSAWRWVDDFPADQPVRNAVETEIAEAALALSELWLAAPMLHEVVRADELASELCRLATTVPYALVTRQVRNSLWQSGAECLLSAAARVADEDATALARVQQTARELVARRQLEATNELADELGL